jgi:branched-chain amino acid transport system ATP-binding protein
LPVLEARGVAAGYGRMEIVRDVNLAVEKEKLVTIIGPNGAGKSTVLKSILGFNKLFAGSILIGGEDVTKLPTFKRVAYGLGYVPQGRQVFPDLTVRENLRMGGFLVSDAALVRERIESMFELFPRLGERASVAAGSMSGGEQQMLAMARALMTAPTVLLLDEPTLGLAPVVVEQIMEQILEMKSAGISMLMVEQNATLALEISDHAYVVDGGTSGPRLPAHELLASDEVRRLYLGASG